MNSNDEFENKSNIIPTIPIEITCSHTRINPSQYHMSTNLNTNLLQSLHSYTYEPLHDALITSLNPNANPMLSLDNQELIKDKNEENQEKEQIRRLKRMISNRDSARRSRLRKRREIENLQHQVYQLVSANHQLVDKLNQVMVSNYQIFQENVQLRKDVAALRKDLGDLFMSMKGGLEEEGVSNLNDILIRASQTITSASINSTSMDVI